MGGVGGCCGGGGCVVVVLSVFSLLGCLVLDGENFLVLGFG